MLCSGRPRLPLLKGRVLNHFPMATTYLHSHGTPLVSSHHYCYNSMIMEGGGHDTYVCSTSRLWSIIIITNRQQMLCYESQHSIS